MESQIVIEDDLETELINNQLSSDSDEEPKHTQEFFKASIVNLVSALGGPDYCKPDSPYVLGNEALGCLKDLKRWLRGHDEKLKTIDIAYAISQTTLVTFDLLEILSMWDKKEDENDAAYGPYTEDIEENEKKQELDKRQKERKKDFLIALGCLEVLVPLTWPVDTSSGDLRIANLKRSQVDYKQAILEHPSNRILKSVIRLCEPSISREYLYTTNKHKDTMKRAFYLFRNISRINYRDSITNVPSIDRNTLLKVFQDQWVFGFIISVASGINTDFPELCIPILECLYFISKGIEVIDLFDISDQTSHNNDLSSNSGGRDLKSLLLQDKYKAQAIRQKSNRWTNDRSGSFFSVQDRNGNVPTDPISGKITVTPDNTFSLDSILALGKKAKLQRRLRSELATNYEDLFEFKISLEPSVRDHTAMFIFEFLSTAFNSLLYQLCDTFSSELSGLFSAEIPPIPFDTQIHFLFVMAWFLEVNRICPHNPLFAAKLKEQEDNESLSEMALVAVALDQKALSCYDVFLRSNVDFRQWPIVLNCLLVGRELLKSIQIMVKSKNDTLITMAKKIMTLMFLREERLTIITTLPRYAPKTYSSSFVRLSVELSYLMIQTFELFEKRDNKIYIDAIERMKRSTKKKNEKGQDGEEKMEDEDEEVQHPRELRQKEYSVEKLLRRYMFEDVVNTQILYFSGFQEMTAKQILNGIKFIHRIFVQGKLHTLYYRLDFIYLLDRMLEYPALLPNVRSEIEKLEKYFRGKLERALIKTPSLFVELMFSKMTSEVFYYENGISKAQAMTTKRDRRIAGKVAPLFDFKDVEYTQSRENKFKIIVAALCDDEKQSLIRWTINQAKVALAKRDQWFDQNLADDTTLAPEISFELNDDEESKSVAIGLRKNSTFRLLLTVCEFELLDKFDKSECVLPPAETTVKLAESISYMEKYISEGVEFPDHKGAYDFIEKKRRRRARLSTFSSDSESNDKDDTGEMDGFVVNDDSDNNGSNGQDESEEEAEYATGERHGTHRISRSSKSSSSSKKEKRRRKESKTGENRSRNPNPQHFSFAATTYKSSEFIDSEDELFDEEELKKFYEMEERQRQQFSKLNDLNTVHVRPDGELEFLQDKYLREMDMDSETPRKQTGSRQNANDRTESRRPIKRKSLTVAKRGSKKHDDVMSEKEDDLDIDEDSEEERFLSSEEEEVVLPKKHIHRKALNAASRKRKMRLSDPDSPIDLSSAIDVDFESESIYAATNFDTQTSTDVRMSNDLVDSFSNKNDQMLQVESDDDDRNYTSRLVKPTKRTKIMDSDEDDE